MQIGAWNISLIDLYLLSGMAVLLLIELYFYLRYIRLPKRKRSTDEQEIKMEHAGDQLDLFDSNIRGVSVIVAARNEAYNLADYLPALLEQDYPMFEVIVVDDGSEDGTRALLDELSLHYPRLRHSFVPRQARIISSKKLALSLGIKAARYDYLLFTDADCRPASRFWIQEMMQGFDSDQTQVVLGYGAYFKQKGMLNRLVRYDTLFNGLHYLGSARAGHPYMGVGRNLAYRKEWFNNSKGFTPFLGMMAGDDDLLVNHAATGKNTATIATPKSLTWSPAKTSWRDWWHQKHRHLSVSPAYTLSSRLRLGIEPLVRGAWYALAVWLLLRGWGMVQWAVLALLGVRLLTRSLVLNLSAKRLGVPKVGIDLLLWDMLLPLISLWILVFPYRQPKRW